jgi:hypothetical protein
MYVGAGSLLSGSEESCRDASDSDWDSGQNKQDRIAEERAGCWWLTPVILATWQAEIKRISVQGQPQANSLWRLCQQRTPEQN